MKPLVMLSTADMVTTPRMSLSRPEKLGRRRYVIPIWLVLQTAPQTGTSDITMKMKGTIKSLLIKVKFNQITYAELEAQGVC